MFCCLLRYDRARHTASRSWLSAQLIPRILKSLPALWLALCAIPGQAADNRYPEYPFADEYRWMYPNDETGTAPRQVHFAALASVISGKSDEDPYLGGKFSLDFIVDEFVSVRLSVAQDLMQPNGDGLPYRFSSFRVGPSLHFFPYQRFDMGTYAEAGMAVVDFLSGKTGSKNPEVVLGGFIMFYATPSVFIRAELERAWSKADINGRLTRQHRSAALLGLGVVF